MISIIIPTYNRAHLICETISSIINQSYRNWELIIVDDGSTDKTFKVVKPFLEDTRINIVKRPRNRPSGGNAARNYGLEISQGNYVKWLDSDDLLEKDCLEKQFNTLISDNADVIFCRSRFFNQNSTTGKIEFGPLWNEGFKKPGNILENFILGQLRFSNNDGLWKRNILPDKPYSENLKNSQEFLMITRMLAKNIKVELIDEVLVLVRTHTDQMASKRDYSVYAKNQILARYLVIKDLKNNNKITLKIYSYLLKSIIYYIAQQIKRLEFKFFISNLLLFIKSVFQIPLKQAI